MTVNAEQLARSFISSHAKTSSGTDLVLDGSVENAVSAWLDTTEQSLIDAFVEKGEVRDMDLIEGIRAANADQVPWRVRYILNKDDPALWSDPARIPMDV
jgi:hypothetical protein